MTDKKFMLMVEREWRRQYESWKLSVANPIRRQLAPITSESKELVHKNWQQMDKTKKACVHKASFMAGAEYALTILKIEARQRKLKE